jgi:hypothetical protein
VVDGESPRMMNARAQKCVVGVLQLPYKIQGWKDAEMLRCKDAKIDWLDSAT